MPKLTIRVDLNLCIGAASCVTVSPTFFGLNEENKAYVKDPAKEDQPHIHERAILVSDEQKEQIILAAQSCPTLAISVFDEDGAQLFPNP